MGWDDNEVELKTLVGKTLKSIVAEVGGETVEIETSDGERFRMCHCQDCCERVAVSDIVGDLSDLIGSPLVEASENSNQDNPPHAADSFTWTFYRLSTVKGTVTIRWLGESNGYYSESVDFIRVAS